MATYNGTSGNDSLFGYKGSNNTINGLGGNDTIFGGDGGDILDGGDGNDILIAGIGNNTLIGGGGVNELYGGIGNDTYIINNSTSYIYDSGGTDTAIVSANFVKIPLSIENVTYTPGVQVLPYWIDALVDSLGNGSYFKTLLGPGKTMTYSFPTSLPSYDNRAKDAVGWQPFNESQKIFVRQALSYIATLIDVKFVESAVSDVLNNIAFANNQQTGSSGYSIIPVPAPLASDLFLDTSPASPGNSNPTDGSYSALTVIHELGHALGLKHPFMQGSPGAPIEQGPYLPKSEDNTVWTVMTYTSQPAQYQAVLRPLDIAALQYIYGVNPSYKPGNDVYVVSATTTNLISDGGGNDTLDASQQTSNATIYLEPGYWGFLGTKAATITAPGQVSVNFGTTIENLKSGSGNDFLVGNAADNQIEGGAGNDTIDGGDGVDTAVFANTFSNYTFNYSSASKMFTVSSALTGTDSITNVEFFKFSDVLKTASELMTTASEPTVSLLSPTTSITEGNSGSQILTFTVNLSAAATSVVTVNYASANGTATAGSDYTATNGVLTFAAGETSKTISVGVLGDTAVELDETFTLSLSNPSGASLGSISTAMATILNDDTTNTATTNATKARVFLGSNDVFTVNDSNATVFSGSSGGTVKLAAGVSGVKTDPNFTRIELSGILADYKLVGLAGTGLQIQNSSGTVINTIASLNNDIIIAFANGSALLKQTGGSAFSLGGVSISTSAPATVSATLNASDTSTFSTSASRFTTKARILMDQNDSITITDNGATLIGNTNTTAKIASGVTGVKTDANFTRLELSGSLADYKIGAIAGIGLQIQNASGVTVDTISSLNNNLTLAFANGSAPLIQTGGSAFSLGGVSIGTAVPSTLNVVLNTADKSTLSPSGITDVNVSSANIKFDDFAVLQFSSPDIVGADIGNDTYLISSSMVSAGKNLTISDSFGSNSIQLADGLSIASSQVTSNALQLTLSNGGTVTILSANLFTYDVGGNTSSGIDNVDVSYASFVQNTLGVTLPATGVVSGAARLIGTGPAKSVIPVLSMRDDFSVLQPSSPAIVGADVGNDTYLISGSMVSAGQSVTISDSFGSNSIQLASGLSIASSQVTSNALQLTLSNGGVVTVLGASAFTYDVGGNTTAGIDNIDVGYASFVQNTLGVIVPTTGVASGGAKVIGSAGATPATVLVAGSAVPVTATSGADVFSFAPTSAKALTASTQIVVNQFNTAQDKFQFDLITALGATTLAALNGVEGISIQADLFTGSTLVNFGNNTNGNLVTLTLAGVTTPASVMVDVI